MRTLLSATLLVVLAATAVPMTPVRAEDKKNDGFVALFNGKDLTGWKQWPKADPKSIWEVKDGLLCGSGPASHLFSERGDYVNFVYRIEAKINAKGNSGQYCRTAFGGGFPSGYEIQINATHSDPVKTGSLYPAGPLGKFRDKITVLNTAPHEPDEFFTQQVTVIGNKISIEVNGKKTIEFIDEANNYKTGHFALQQHDPGSKVSFRKIEVKELPADAK